ncbi:hypothetical protein AB0425_17435 [Actinosynnema sp. NPDC051121]
MSEDEEGGLYFHSIDYRERDGRQRGQLLNRGFWLHRVPRLMLLCRLFGHRPVVDGTKGYRKGDRGSRWVCCDRCGVRPNPQGSLDPELWSIGQPYTGPYTDTPHLVRAMKSALGLDKPTRPPFSPPGPFPARPTGTLGGQLVVGGRHSLSAEVKIGNAGSEHTLAAHASIPRIGWLSVHTERFGTWLQRRLIPTEYESREIGFSAHDGTVHWKLWAPRNSWSHDQPKWWAGSFPYDLRDVLWGPLSYSYENVGDPVPVVVRMPYSDEDNHDVVLQLQHQRLGRKRGKPRDKGWTVQWDCKAGIPYRVDDGWKGGRIQGSSVKVSQHAVDNGTWPLAAAAAIADDMMRQRVRYRYLPHHLEDDVEPAMDLG